jgi:hypothetical protein
MDFSKLRKLSQTTTPRNDDAASADPPQPEDRDPAGDDSILTTALDVFLALGVGIIFMFLGSEYGRFKYTQVTGGTWHTGLFWQAPHPKANQEVTLEELSPENRAAHEQNMLSQSSLFLLGAAMAIAGLAMIGSKISMLPPIGRQVAAGLGVLITAAGLLYALWAMAAMFKSGVTPLLTMIAVLVGGMTLFMQAASMRAIGAAPPPRRRPRPQLSIAAGATSAVSPARMAHHRFAHQTLRQEVFADPARVVGILQGPGGRVHLSQMWDNHNRAMGISAAANPDDGLNAEMTQVGPYSAVIVTMPPPQRQGEAYFAGIVLRSYVRQDGAVIQRQPVLLYYTLESTGGTGNASLCEWEAGDHVGFSDSIPPQFAAFREAMWQKVMARQAAEDQLAAQPRA